MSYKTVIRWLKYGILTVLLYRVTDVSSIETECRRCRSSLQKDTSCFNQSISYYTQSLLDSLNEFSTSLLYLSHLRSNQPELVEQLTNFESEIVDRILGDYNSSLVEDSTLLTHSDLQQIFTLVLNKTSRLQSEFGDKLVLLPSLSCPSPCDYDSTLYKQLFYVILAAFILCVICSLTYVFIIMRRHSGSGYVNTFGAIKKQNLVM